MTSVAVALPEKLIPVFHGPADVRGAHGGRGSGKTRSFAKMSAVRGYMFGRSGQSGLILCARQFMNSLEDSSLEEVKRAIEEEPFLAAYYEVGEKYIRSKDGRIDFSFTGLDRNIASVKSKGRILICWVDEAEPVPEESWRVLIPTLREEGSGWNAELWVTWNPQRKAAPVDLRFRHSKDPLVKVVELNWKDNPKFPAKLERERLRDKEERPDQYEHVWEGAYATTMVGAYFTKHLIDAKAKGRIIRLSPDPLMIHRAFIDIGGTGVRSDAFTMWIAQFVGRELRAINHYEAVGQPLGAHLNWLEMNGYTNRNTKFWLPHDGRTQDRVFDVSYESALQQAGFQVVVVPNQGAGAASTRIEAGRRVFPSIWFDDEKTLAGREAVGYYHEKKDVIRNIGLGPDHDWSSHSCLAGNTLVLTTTGLRRIDEISIGDYVITPVGPSKVLNAGRTKVVKEINEIFFSDGTSIKATGEHKFFTTKGVATSDTLRNNMALISLEDEPCLSQVSVASIGYRDAFIESFGVLNTGCGKPEGFTVRKLEESRFFFTEYCLRPMMAAFQVVERMLFRSMETGNVSIHQTGRFKEKAQTGQSLLRSFQLDTKASCITQNRQGISRQGMSREVNISIVPFGLQRLAQSLVGFISTIKTKTRQITALRTLNVLKQGFTQATIQRQVNGLEAKKTESNFLRQGILRLNGTDQQKDGPGTKKTESLLGRTGRSLRSLALFVAKRSKQNGQQEGSSALHVVSKRVITGVSLPVYDLTVEKHHCYYANSVLVSNSDSFGLMCCVWESEWQDRGTVADSAAIRDRKLNWRA